MKMFSKANSSRSKSVSPLLIAIETVEVPRKTCSIFLWSKTSYGSPFPRKAVCYGLQIEPIFIFLHSLIISV